MRKLLIPALILLAGCGMEAVDIRMEARSESGLQQYPLELVEGEFVCPHVVSIDNQSFDVKAVIRGDVEDKFGPFVPCLTKVPAGGGTCPSESCGQEYRTSGTLEEGEEGPPMALPLLKCPHAHSGGDQLIDPVAVFVKGNKDSILGYTNCPKCKKYFTIKETDLLTTIDVHEETLCPTCSMPVDPGMNACPNANVLINQATGKYVYLTPNTGEPIKVEQSGAKVTWQGDRPVVKGGGASGDALKKEGQVVELDKGTYIYRMCPLNGGQIRNVPDYEGPCWRCGGMGACPNCKGSGKGNLGIYDKSPAECWTCGTEGKCPECEGTGFSKYEGTLPKAYKAYGREQKALPSVKRKWQHDHSGGTTPPIGDMSGDDLGGPEDEDLGPEEIPGGDEESGGSRTRGEDDEGN